MWDDDLDQMTNELLEENGRRLRRVGPRPNARSEIKAINASTSRSSFASRSSRRDLRDRTRSHFCVDACLLLVAC